MNKNQLKRYKRIGEEISQLHQDLEDAQKWLDDCYLRRDFVGARDTFKTIENIYHEIGIREVIRAEMLLPQSLKIEGGIKEINDFMKDNDIVENYETFLEEYCSIYLLDNYNHCHFDFTYHSKGDDIYLTNIRWNQHQLLVNDLKRLLKNELPRIEIGDVHLIKNAHFKNTICLYDRREPNYQNFSLNEAIKWLEEHYYL